MFTCFTPLNWQSSSTLVDGVTSKCTLASKPPCAPTGQQTPFFASSFPVARPTSPKTVCALTTAAAETSRRTRCAFRRTHHATERQTQLTLSQQEKQTENDNDNDNDNDTPPGLLDSMATTFDLNPDDFRREQFKGSSVETSFEEGKKILVHGASEFLLPYTNGALFLTGPSHHRETDSHVPFRAARSISPRKMVLP